MGRLGGAEHRARKQPSDLRQPPFAPASTRSGWRPVGPRGPAGCEHCAVAEHQHEPQRGRAVADRRHHQRGRQSCFMADLAGVRWSAGRVRHDGVRPSDLRLPRRPGDGGCVPRRHEAQPRLERWQVLLSAGRDRPCPGSQRRSEGPVAEHRSSRSRAGIEGDVAFTGPNDTVPWTVLYENSDSDGGHPSARGLFNADMVFAARAIADGSGDGGFHWQTVGLGTAGKTAANDILNTSGPNGIGECGQSTANEQACSLGAASASGLDGGTGAENPSVTAGTLVAGKATTPWIAWDESSANGGLHSVFVARLDAAGDHFDLLNNGEPISHSGLDSRQLLSRRSRAGSARAYSPKPSPHRTSAPQLSAPWPPDADCRRSCPARRHRCARSPHRLHCSLDNTDNTRAAISGFAEAWAAFSPGRPG